MTISPERVTPLEQRVRKHWKPLLLILGAAAIGNLAFAPNWNSLQTAASAPSFTSELAHPGRVLAAGACDIVFAASYGTLGYVGLRRWGRSRLALVAALAVAAGAAFDELENATLITNVIRRDDLTDRWVELMRLLGTLKWIAAPAVLLLYAYLLRAALRPRSNTNLT